MVQYLPTLDTTFSALSDPTRRAILERLARGSATISELAEPAEMSLTGLKKHVRVLEEAELVSTEKRGRARHCRLGPRRLEDVSQWLEDYRRGWEERFDRVEEIVERKRGTSR
jgi:DNA-binding transcriptional ArsR family regulator